jgi:hypothetical protein
MKNAHLGVSELRQLRSLEDENGRPLIRSRMRTPPVVTMPPTGAQP